MNIPDQHQSLLCRYQYDPLDRLVNLALPDTPQRQRFYCKNRLASEIQGALQHSIVQHGDLLLAQQQHQGERLDTTLLITDQQRSVLHTLKAHDQAGPIAYSPYGHRPAESGLLSLLGFNGERPDPVTGHYLLGNGYRAFNPVLMRFNSPDSLSPFGDGGLNSYAYCLGDPVNSSDASGHSPSQFMRSILESLVSTPTSNKSFQTRHGLRPWVQKQRRLSDPTPTIPSLVKPDFMGYHGTGKYEANELLTNRVKPVYDGYSKGFFLSPDVTTTFEYASKGERLAGIYTPEFKTYGKANVVEVHVKNLTGMKQGKDYDYNYYSSPWPTKHHSMEIFIAHHKSTSIFIRTLGSTPETKKVRPRAHEAPF